MSKLPDNHPLRSKVSHAEQRHAERIKTASELAPKRAAIHKRRKQGVAFSSKIKK